MQVQEIMHRGAEVIDPNMMIRDAAAKMRAENVGALPVGENDRLIGMVTDRDIVCRAVADNCLPGNTAVRDVMSEHVYWCFDDADLEDAAKMMAEHQVRRLPVINHDKRLVGMVALADLGRCDAKAAMKALEGVSEPTSEPRR